jgi:hypothetical protein
MMSSWAADDVVADLVVIGSRGLRAVHAVVSTSERVAHEANMSVLIMRPQREPRGARLVASASAQADAARTRERAIERRIAGGEALGSIED